MKRLIAAAVLAIAPVAHADLFACKKDDGTILVQPTPCTAAQVSHVGEKPPANPFGHSNELSPEQIKRINAAVAAIPPPTTAWKCSNQSMIGRTADDVYALCGYPTKKNVTGTASHRREQWVYEQEGIYLYIVDGVLASFQR